MQLPNDILQKVKKTLNNTHTTKQKQTNEPLHNSHLWGQKKVTVVESFKQELMYGLSAKKVAIGGVSTVACL